MRMASGFIHSSCSLPISPLVCLVRGHEVQQREDRSIVALGNADHQAQIGFDELLR
jgi:hypothetical protein